MTPVSKTIKMKTKNKTQTKSKTKTKNTSQNLDAKIQQLKDKQHILETKMVQQLHRALKSHQGFSLPFPVLIGGLIEVMDHVKANSNQVEAWNMSGRKFLRKRSKQQPNILSSKNSPIVSAASTAMENSHDQA